MIAVVVLLLSLRECVVAGGQSGWTIRLWAWRFSALRLGELWPMGLGIQRELVCCAMFTDDNEKPCKYLLRLCPFVISSHLESQPDTQLPNYNSLIAHHALHQS